MKKVILQRGKDKAAWQLHPWVFSGAIKEMDSSVIQGDDVQVFNDAGEFIAYGVYNKQSRVAVRLLEWHPDVIPDESWWRSRIQKAISSRRRLLTAENNTCRLIFAEADFLPGLIVDLFGDFISIQVHSVAAERYKEVVLDKLVQLLHPKGIYERSDQKSRKYEGLDDANGLKYGVEPPEFVEVIENGIRYHINIVEGQKSGFYCDQREKSFFDSPIC